MVVWLALALTMVPTCKKVAIYSPTPLNVGTMVNAPPRNSLYLFLPFLCHPCTDGMKGRPLGEVNVLHREKV